ncbi:unnamed protein product [Rotaria sordida]|uniref:Uncharacterized protein n=1 Tax=Rotaria sordida TaxID=392033 RepID=A0A815EGJ4_9BILA|nr:unnamed protein product [Rotaria sordida]CAF1580575.1 unnamed protein product [Rotaria sordida]
MGNADESIYTVNLINNQTTTILLDFLLLLLPLSTYDDSLLLDSLLNTTIKQKCEDKHLHSSLIQTSLENSDIDSGWRSTSCLNLLDLALKQLFESFPFYFLIN